MELDTTDSNESKVAYQPAAADTSKTVPELSAEEATSTGQSGGQAGLPENEQQSASMEPAENILSTSEPESSAAPDGQATNNTPGDVQAAPVDESSVAETINNVAEATNQPNTQSEAEIVEPVSEKTVNEHPIVPVASPVNIDTMTEQELEAAAKRYFMLKSRDISALGVKARQDKMNRNLMRLRNYLGTRGTAQIPSIARELNLSPRLISRYLQALVAVGEVTASGWANKRTYKITK